MINLLLGDCRDLLKNIDDNRVDSIVTDPPYELGLIGLKWDRQGIAYNTEIWKECFRVLKPGGHLLSFGGNITYHRLVCAIEDSGFEIRDLLVWIRGEGMPKGTNIGNKIAKKEGKSRSGAHRKGRNTPGGKLLNLNTFYKEYEHSDTSQKWKGYNTALKSLLEPICLARKPVSEDTIAKNVLKWGTGGLNIDGCRIPNSKVVDERYNPNGRFPSNVILDRSDDVMEAIPKNAHQFFYCAKASKVERNFLNGKKRNMSVTNKETCMRYDNPHPTVKPLELIKYLVRLVTPEGGIVLDPFMGSGTTGVACLYENFSFIGMEINKDYFNISKTRIDSIKEQLLFTTE